MAKHYTDSKMKFRDKMSAMIYVAMVMVCIALCTLATIANPSTFARAFTDDNVVGELQQDVVQYAKDMSEKNNIPDDFVEDSITYQTMYKLEESYIYGNLGGSAQYNENAFDGLIEELKEQIAQSVIDMEDKQGITVDSSLDSDVEYTFAESISSYAKGRVAFDYMKNVKNVVKIMRIMAYVLIVIFGVILIILIAILCSKGGKNYRIVRNIAYPVLGCSILNLVFVLIVAIVKATKDLIIYPLYIAQAFMSYVNESMITLSAASGALFVVFLALTVLSWKMKRDEKD